MWIFMHKFLLSVPVLLLLLYFFLDYKASPLCDTSPKLIKLDACLTLKLKYLIWHGINTTRQPHSFLHYPEPLTNFIVSKSASRIWYGENNVWAWTNAYNFHWICEVYAGRHLSIPTLQLSYTMQILLKYTITIKCRLLLKVMDWLPKCHSSWAWLQWQ